jgi:MFS family permease
MIGSSFLAGAFAGSFVLPRLADVFGRKPMFLVGLILYIATVLGLLLSTSKAMLYSLLVLGGISETGRYYVAYVYAVEIFPKAK